jgi:hypothetical protein
MAENEKKVALEVWNNLDGNRSTTMDRAIECSELTIPYLFREDTKKAQDDYEYNYVQGFGAKLVNHLVGKFALSILPPSQPFYRLSATNEAMEAVSNGDENAKFQIEKILAQREEEILRYVNKSAFRASLYPALRLSCVTGDALIEKNKDDTFRVFSMNNYVVKRDSVGNILTIVIKEMIDYVALPEEIQSTIPDQDKASEIELFTICDLMDGKYEVWQEVSKEIVKGSEKTLKNLSDQFISVRWTKMPGEDYGRAFVEDYKETLKDLDNQLRVMSQSAAVSSKSVFAVNPNGNTKYRDYVDAKNGDVIIGNAQDISVVRVDKSQDLSSSYALANDYKRELSEAFLMSSAAIRDSERTTAYEVQQVAAELEASFGGVYTSISTDIQMPLIKNAMNSLKIETDKDIDVIITTGVEALGRNVEMSKINGMMQELSMFAGLVGAEAIAKSINADSVISAIVANSGVASRNFLVSQMEKEQIEAQNQLNQFSQQVAGSAAAPMGMQAAEQMMEAPIEE